MTHADEDCPSPKTYKTGTGGGPVTPSFDIEQPDVANKMTEKLINDKNNDKKSKMSNQHVLAVTTVLFAGFVIAEIIGALVRRYTNFLFYQRIL